MSCDADTTANALIESLTAGKSFVIPEVDLTKPEFQFPYDPNCPLYTQVKPLTVDQLTTRVPGGSGVFDALMDSFRAHLKEEMEKGRITGAEYTKTYIALSESAMNQAAAFILGKDESFWQAQTAQIGALTARVELETAKINLTGAQLQALNQEAVYALTKMKLASEDVDYCISKFNLEQTLPAQLAMTEVQKAGALIANSTAQFNLEKTLPAQLEMTELQKAGAELANQTATYNLATILPLQQQMLIKQVDGQGIQNNTATYTLSTMLPLQSQMVTKQVDGQNISNNTATFNLSKLAPQQLLNLQAQQKMINEQMEAQRGQTHDLRSDNIPVAGVMGKQKLLYTQQVTSYQRDAEVKAAKIFTDAWITQKTIDEGLLPPPLFNNSSVDGVLQTLKASNGFS